MRKHGKHMDTPQRPEFTARGFRDGELKRIAVSMTEEVFDEIRCLAVSQRTSFGQQVRLLIQRGLHGL